jgi:hypothetical protein
MAARQAYLTSQLLSILVEMSLGRQRYREELRTVNECVDHPRAFFFFVFSNTLSRPSSVTRATGQEAIK